jgi:hypothetical protein
LNVKVCEREMCFIASSSEDILKMYNLYQFHYSCGLTARCPLLTLHLYSSTHLHGPEDLTDASISNHAK